MKDRESLANVYGWDNSDTRTSQAKGIATASQDSVDYNNGLMTTSVEHTRQLVGFTGSIDEQIKLMQTNYKETLNTCNSILKGVNNIDSNTQKLNGISENISAMRSDINSILLHGITLKK